MLQLIVAIRGNVDDETEAHRILHYLDNACEEHPEDNLTATCQTKQIITND